MFNFPIHQIKEDFLEADDTISQIVEYINNTEVSSKDSGHIYGFKFGHKKVSRQLQWKAGFHYQRLERDAWLDVFPNADAFGGETDSESYVFTFAYGLMDRIIFGTNYYISESLSDSSDDDKNLQVELLFKF